MANECRSVCGETSRVTPARSAALTSTDHADCRESRPPRALRNSAGVALCRVDDQLGPAADQVGVDRLPRVGADRHDPLLAALAAQQHGAVDGVEVVDVEADRLGDPRAGAVEQLEQRPVAQRQRRAGRAGGLEDRLDVGQRQRLGQPLGRRRRLHAAGRVVGGQPVGDARTCGSPRTATTVRAADVELSGGWSASPSRSAHQEAGHRRLGDVVEVVDAALGRGTRGSAAGRGGTT